MADQGSVSKVGTGQVVPLGNRTPAAPTAGRAVSTPGAGRREVPDQSSRQWVNIDGQQLNKSAPRGTYLNILV